MLVRAGLAVFGALALFAFSMSLSQVRMLFLRSTPSDAKAPRFHFALYLPENRDSFFEDLIVGAEKAAAEFDAALSLHSVEPARNDLEMAPYAGMDGAVVCPYIDDSIARRQLARLKAKNIPVVLINHNVPDIEPWPYIGTNNFDIGKKMGTLAAKFKGGTILPAIVYSDKAPGMLAERELVEMGLAEALRSRLTVPVLGLRTSRNPLDAEQVIYKLLRDSPHINTLIFTDANDTIAAAQVLIDLNLVGRVRVIGFGGDPGIREFIRKGIIAGSIVVDPGRIGYEAVRSLVELRTTGYTSASNDAGAEIIEGSGS
jgi:ribose transport system substrate-binding protein